MATSASLGSITMGEPRPLPRWLTARPTAIAGNTLLVFLVGLGDWATGIELPFTILYLAPVALGTWLVNRRFGLAMATAATGWISASLLHEGVTTSIVAWNVSGAMLLVLGVVWATDRLHHYVEQERLLRRVAVDQLRHAVRLNVIGTLAAGVAHELGTPLNVIAGCAELVTAETSDERVHRRMRTTLDQITKISTIIRRLLDFGRRDGHTRARVDLAAVSTTAAEMLHSTAQKRGATIEVDARDPVWLEGNAAELEQVMSNLILNAIQAMKRGRVHVRVGTATRADQRLACVEVEDEGCGVPAANLEHIFDPFFTTKGVGEGTGLGLSVSYGIVRDHGGTIEVASEPGHGSRFSVLLPLAS